MSNNPAPPAVLRLADLESYLGLKRTAIYQLLDGDPLFPRQIRLTAKAVGWRRTDVDAWLATREVVHRGRAEEAVGGGG